MKIPKDKLKHLVVGFLIGMLFMLVAKDNGFSQNAYMAIGAGATAFFAIAKEIRDKVTGKGTPEKMDIIYTLLGGWPSILVYDFIKTMIQ